MRRQLRNELLDIVYRGDPEPLGELTDSTSLIRSGLIDSQGLLSMALLVEREIGCPVDFTAVDLAREWDTIADIIRFIESRR